MARPRAHHRLDSRGRPGRADRRGRRGRHPVMVERREGDHLGRNRARWWTPSQGPFRYLSACGRRVPYLPDRSAISGTLQIYVGSARPAPWWSRSLGGAAVDGSRFLPDGTMMTTSAGRLSLYPNLTRRRCPVNQRGLRRPAGAVRPRHRDENQPPLRRRALRRRQPRALAADPRRRAAAGPDGYADHRHRAAQLRVRQRQAELYVGRENRTGVQAPTTCTSPGIPALPSAGLDDVVHVEPRHVLPGGGGRVHGAEFGGVLTPRAGTAASSRRRPLPMTSSDAPMSAATAAHSVP